MKIAIQGQRGSFHHEAAKQFYGDEIQIISCDEFADVFDAVESGAADNGIVAIENSIFGSINQTYDLLQKRDASIIGEVYLHITMHLLVKSGTKQDDIKFVYSQTPALAQCRDYLKKHLPSAKLVERGDTAESAEYVARLGEGNAAAIASGHAGRVNNLESLSVGIEDSAHSYTRFVAIGKPSEGIEGKDKTSLIMKTDHTPGALQRSLQVFADAGINLCSLQSRPIPGLVWEYKFYVDCEDTIDSPSFKEAIEELRRLNSTIQILGSYKSGRKTK